MENDSGDKKFLVIQTASIGDVILATAVLEKLNTVFPRCTTDILVKKGCEELFALHPFLHNIIVWNKKQRKHKNLRRILLQVRSEKYDYVINLHRFASSGFITAFSGAKVKAGFSKNPFSMFFDIKVKHSLSQTENIHETQRNQALLQSFAPGKPGNIRLYPSEDDFTAVKKFKGKPYITLAPLSLWFTKQYPLEKWIELINKADPHFSIFLLGSEKDASTLDQMLMKVNRDNIQNLAGKLTLLQTAALMKDATMNFANDSAPIHIASAMNARVTAIFCSTIPEFGFAPLSYDAVVIQTEEKLACRPCGIHGKKECPEKNMICGYSISASKLIERINYE